MSRKQFAVRDDEERSHWPTIPLFVLVFRFPARGLSNCENGSDVTRFGQHRRHKNQLPLRSFPVLTNTSFLHLTQSLSLCIMVVPANTVFDTGFVSVEPEQDETALRAYAEQLEAYTRVQVCCLMVLVNCLTDILRAVGRGKAAAGCSRLHQPRNGWQTQQRGRRACRHSNGYRQRRRRSPGMRDHAVHYNWGNWGLVPEGLHVNSKVCPATRRRVGLAPRALSVFAATMYLYAPSIPCYKLDLCHVLLTICWVFYKPDVCSFHRFIANPLNSADHCHLGDHYIPLETMQPFVRPHVP